MSRVFLQQVEEDRDQGRTRFVDCEGAADTCLGACGGVRMSSCGDWVGRRP
jgi:hypothetical protein